jgi:glycosyltransferase involved in cell wall biosynthesis
MKSLRLLVIDPGFQLWGSERALAATLQALVDAWGQVVLVTPQGSALADLAIEQRLNGALVIAHAPIENLHRKGGFARLMALCAIALLVIKFRPQRIYLNQAGLSRLLVPIARIACVPLIIHVRLIEDVPKLARLLGTRRSPLHKIYVSQAMLGAYSSAVAPYTHSYMAYDAYSFSAGFHRQPTPVVDFVSLGRISYGKGPHLLLRALANPRVARLKADAHIFGEGVEGDDYIERLFVDVSALALEERVTFFGFCRDVTARLSRYRFLVLTSKFEPLGRVIMEAWEAGVVPIAYSGSGGSAEIILKSAGGLIFQDWTAESLAATLLKASNMTDESRREMAQAGLDWGKRHLSLEQYRSCLRGALFLPSVA